LDHPKTIPQILPGDAVIVHADVRSELERGSQIGGNIASIFSAIGLAAVAGTN
jgi:hypothetical protein